MSHRRPLVFAFVAVLFGRSPRAAAQEVVATGIGLGYIALGVGAGMRLLEGSTIAHVGDEVRVSVHDSAGSRTIRGRLMTSAPGAVTIATIDGEIRIPAAAVRELRVLRGRESKWAQGWAMGASTGALVGAVVGFSSGDDPPQSFFAYTAGQKAGILGVAGALSGSLVGAAIGVLLRDDHWQRAVSAAGAIAVAPIVGPSPGVAIRWTF